MKRNSLFIVLLFLNFAVLLSACDSKQNNSEISSHKPFEEVDSIQLASGELYRMENFETQYVSNRNVDVWKPNNFDPTKDYQVLWMHDGQMLFDKNQTWNQQEWGIDENLTQLMKQEKIKPTIVVTTWNVSENRHANYFPEKPFHQLDSLTKKQLISYNRENSDRLFTQIPNADDYLKFLVHEVKPKVEQRFKIEIDRSNTTVGGSSMGGLISFYAVTEYPDTFGNAICMSTHWPGGMPYDANPFPTVFFDYLDEKLPELDQHKFYFDFGTATLDSLYPKYQKPVDQLFSSNGFDESNFRNLKFEGHEHKESYWQQRIGDAIYFISK